jgi:ribosomal subunit interface protein
MNINIKATNLSLTSSISEYVNKKIQILEKFLNKKEPIDIFIEIGKPSKHHQHGDIYYAEANIKMPGNFFRVQVSGSDIYLVIDQLKDELKLEIKKDKEKKQTKNLRKERSFKKARALSPMSRLRRKARVDDKDNE